jgi:hypothetical protein
MSEQIFTVIGDCAFFFGIGLLLIYSLRNGVIIDPVASIWVSIGRPVPYIIFFRRIEPVSYWFTIVAMVIALVVFAWAVEQSAWRLWIG